MQLTETKEVSVFIDDNQFGNGESVDKCGPEALALFWHSVKPGQKNTYTSQSVHTMAHSLYEQFIGPDVPGDKQGTSNETLYKMIESLGFKYYKAPDSIALDPDKAYPWVRGWLQAGYPVVLGGINESAVRDTALSGLRNPYNWDTTGLFHIILATGPERPGFLRVRDTANIDQTTGKVRPGPRVYETAGLTITTATMLVPSWLPDPKSSTPPAAPPSWQEEIQVHLDAIQKIIAQQ